ncbi:tRNA (adenine-N(1)-)-methyltransferase [Aspergillus lucknowensis]|uniref:tRNA (adenine(58)-N(1))-methyltransferase catalytic subunit TRM61 n=1 Tax=Aspergillus lucknowensis TaxID=176173 RepID=A0ABR4L849_9EURO
MARLLQSLRRFLGLNRSSSTTISIPRFGRSIDTDFSFFREGDRVVIHGRNPLLTKPLQRGQKSDTRRGQLEHDQIIGRRVRDLVRARKGPEYRLTLPTLEEYVALTPRLVTPIYAPDASLIVSLLDIHVSPPGDGGDGNPPLEILESGTGHGSLTLQLSRAIQAANSLPPPIPAGSQVKYLEGRPIRPDEGPKEPSKQAGDGTQTAVAEVDTTQHTWDAWRAKRKAIVHTVDVSPKFSAHAESIVRGFRRGIYAGNIDFYVGHVENWIAEQIRQRTTTPTTNLFSLSKHSRHPEPFLTHVILDMPSANLRVPHVTPILKRNGVLAVFMPSVTQIGECVDLIRKERLPLVLEKAVELGSGISNGRLWDIRFAVKKSRADPSSWANADNSAVDGDVIAATEEVSASSGEDVAVEQTQGPYKEPEGVLVCRPKVGSRIVGGGFVGIWRRIEDPERDTYR